MRAEGTTSTPVRHFHYHTAEVAGTRGGTGEEKDMNGHGYACGCAGCSNPDVHPAVLDFNTWPASKTRIEYSFNTHDWTGDVDRNERLTTRVGDWYQERIRDAMDAWEEVCNVRFVEVADGPDVDLRIGMGPQIWIPEIGAYSAGYYRTTERDAFGNREEGVVVFRTGSDWGSNPDTRFYDLALHEIGHALGLKHSNLEGTVMSGPPSSAYADPNPGRDRLTSDDVAGARELFGLPLRGTNGDDRLAGTYRDDHLTGYGGDDVLSGGGGNDFLYGGPGNDTLYGGSGNDYLFGHAGDDRFIFAPGHGSDVVYFGEGDDRIDLSGFGDRAPTWAQVQAEMTERTFRDSSDMVTRIDLTAFGGGTIWVAYKLPSDLSASDFIGLRSLVLRGTTGDDLLDGTQGPDRVDAFGGDDVVRGHAGDDILVGGSGNDSLVGGSGNDSLFGGAGRDVLNAGLGNDSIAAGEGGDFVLSGAGNDTVRAGGGSDWVEGGDGADLLYGGEGGTDVLSGQAGSDRLIGEGGNDRLWGGGGNDRLWGGDGNDSALAGNEGNDSIDGGAGNDTLMGGSGNDTLIGGAGNDLLEGGGGRDRLTGGSGDDVFRFSSWERGRDVIRDYGNGDDTIELDLPKGSSGGGLSFRAEGGGTLITGNGFEILVLGPDAAGLTLSDVDVV